MTDLQIIHGSDFALRQDGAGADPVDGHQADSWCTVMRLADGAYAPIRRFPSAMDASSYVATQVKAARAASQRRES